MKIRAARMEDFDSIYSLVEDYSRGGLLLPRDREEIRSHLGEFLVLVGRVRNFSSEKEDVLLGCVAIDTYRPGLAEIRSLAVIPQARGRGLGGRLLEAAISTARRRKIARVFAVTQAVELFERHGFNVAPLREAAPEKIARDCFTCPKAASCTLTTLVRQLTVQPDVRPITANPVAVPVQI